MTNRHFNSEDTRARSAIQANQKNKLERSDNTELMRDSMVTPHVPGTFTFNLRQNRWLVG